VVSNDFYTGSTCGHSIFFSPSDIRVPASLAYHIADIYIEELDKALGTAVSPQAAPLATLLEPFFYLAARTPTSTTYKRIQSALIEPLLDALVSERDLEDDPPKAKRIRLSSDTPTFLKSNACFEDPELDGHMAGAILKKKLLRRIFEIASQPETRDSNRRKMYALWKEGAEDDGTNDE
jgi:ribosomal RNA-processing protein 1